MTVFASSFRRRCAMRMRGGTADEGTAVVAPPQFPRSLDDRERERERSASAAEAGVNLCRCLLLNRRAVVAVVAAAAAWRERNSKPAIRSYPKFVPVAGPGPGPSPLLSSPLFLSADETFQLLICDMHEMLETMTQA